MNSTISELFLALGHPQENLVEDSPVDVKDKNFEIESFDFSTNQNTWKKILTIVKKPKTKAYIVSAESRAFTCSPNHRIAISLDKDLTGLHFVEASELVSFKKPFYCKTPKGLVQASVVQTGKETNILDIEVEDTHSYYSNGILSHNTLYGNPEATSGGNALPYYSSVRLRVTSKASPTQKDALSMKVRVVKNKMAPALSKQAEFTFICAQGTDIYDDTFEFAKSIGLIRSAGSAVKITMPGKEEETLCTGGKLGARQHFIENTEYFEQIRQACYSISGLTPSDSTGSELDTNSSTSEEDVVINQ